MADENQKTNEQRLQSRERSQDKQVTHTPQSGGLSRRWPDPFVLSPLDIFGANPFSLMRRMTEEMDRAFGEFNSGRRQDDENFWAPAIEVTEGDQNVVVRAELPGLKPEDVKVELTDNALVIQGERKHEHEETKGGLHRTERRYGQFYRSVPLPQGVDAEQVKAKFENGILEVTAPLPEQQSNRRQIPIDAGSGASAGSRQANA